MKRFLRLLRRLFKNFFQNNERKEPLPELTVKPEVTAPLDVPEVPPPAKELEWPPSLNKQSFLSPDEADRDLMDLPDYLHVRSVAQDFAAIVAEVTEGSPSTEVIIVSCVRSPHYNKVAFGKEQSAHLSGKAIDFYVEGVSVNTTLKVVQKMLHDRNIGPGTVLNRGDHLHYEIKY